MTETLEQKNERNKRVQARYDELMAEGKHGHYETMFRVVREELEAAHSLSGEGVTEGAVEIGARALLASRLKDAGYDLTNGDTLAIIERDWQNEAADARTVLQAVALPSVSASKNVTEEMLKAARLWDATSEPEYGSDEYFRQLFSVMSNATARPDGGVVEALRKLSAHHRSCMDCIMDEDCDLLDRAADALSATGTGGWRPMETAPKDGTHFLARFEDDCQNFDEDDRPLGRTIETATVIAYNAEPFGFMEYPWTGGTPRNRKYIGWQPLHEQPTSRPAPTAPGKE